MPMTAQPYTGDKDSWRLQVDGTHATLTLRGVWRLDSAHRLPSAHDLVHALPESLETLDIVTEDVTDGDSLLPAVLLGIQQALARQALVPSLHGLPETTLSLIGLTEHPINIDYTEHEHHSWLHNLGLLTLKSWANIQVVGSSVFFFLRSLQRIFAGKHQFRWEDFFAAFYHCTLAAIPIVSVVSLLLGSILAFVGAIQLRAFGADIFIADTVGIAVAREMAALMTAIVISGHTGAAFAAQLATMRVNEEVDALRTLGLSPHDYLAVPRVFALTLAMPLLYVYAAVITLAGSMVVSSIVLDLSPVAYMVRTSDAVPLSYFALGLIKSVCFGALIGLVSSHIGLHAGRSAEDVGQAATQAVVISILGIIVLDSLFAVASILFGF